MFLIIYWRYLMSYSIDFRKCVIRNISAGMSWIDAVKTFGISSGTIAKWIHNLSETGKIIDAPRKPYKPRKIDPDLLRAAFDKTPDATLEEIAVQFNCWPQSIHKRCVKLGITRKKNHPLRGEKRGKKA